MFHSKSGRSLLTMTAGFFVAGTMTRAFDASDVLVYSVGPVRVKPRVAVSEQYDDNIFFRPSSPSPFFPSTLSVEDDFIMLISPSVNLQLGRVEGNHITFDYRLDQSLYARHSDEDHQDHSLSLDAKLQGNRIAFDGQTSVQFLSGILGGSLAQLSTNQVATVDRIAYSSSYRVDYNFTEKTSTYMVGAYNATDYKQGTPLYDQNDLRGTAGFAFKATPKTSVFGEGYYGQTATSPNGGLLPAPYSFVYGGFVGVNGDFTTRLKGSVKVGYETRGFGGNTPESGSPAVEASVTDNFSDRTTVSLGYTRRSEVSVQVASQAFTSDAINAQLSQVLTPDGKLVANISGSVLYSEYANSGGYAGRHDSDYRASAALVYNMQLWLSAQLGYEHESFNSNQYFDYSDNRVTLRVSVGY